MTKGEVFEFMNDHPEFYLATNDQGQARVRGLLLHKANEEGIYFTTGKMRDLYKQLKMDPKVELIFVEHPPLASVRVTGLVEELDDDLDLKKEIVSKRPFLKPMIDHSGYEPMAVFRVKNGTATEWRLETTMAPKTYIDL